MPLPLPNLDDRRYTDLVDEALALIPTVAPEWTNHNPSDPGITLVELFAYLTEMLLYRLNRVTDDNTRTFLKLLNGPDWVQPPDADLRDEIREAVLSIRERFRAVTKDDYEYLSTGAFNQSLRSSSPLLDLVARAHCVPQRNLEAGTEADRLKVRPEHVSVMIVPSTGTPALSHSPQPSGGLMAALFGFLDERRMLTTKLHVVGPFYVHVSAELIVARNADAVESDLKGAINDKLARLLNPVPSADSSGWPFGRDVYISHIYQTLESIPGIDYITDMSINSSCAGGDGKCVIADQLWHESGSLIGLRIQDHHLPVFEHASIVIAPADAFIRLNLVVKAKAGMVDFSVLNRAIRRVARGFFHPELGGPGPAKPVPTDIFIADIRVAVKNLPGILEPVAITVDSVPSNAVRQDPNRGAFVHVDAGSVVNWSVAIQLS